MQFLQVSIVDGTFERDSEFEQYRPFKWKLFDESVIIIIIIINRARRYLIRLIRPA